jgi:putative transposase
VGSGWSVVVRVHHKGVAHKVLPKRSSANVPCLPLGLNSQSVQTTGVGGARGYDGAKKIKGRKRHLLVDTQGLVLTVKVHPADVMDRDGVLLLLPPEQTTAQLPRLVHVWLDAGYNGMRKGKDWMEKELGWTTETVRPPSRP